MKSIAEFLEDYAVATGCTSDYQVSKKLSLSRQAVSLYRRGKGAPGIDTCWQIADALKVAPGAVIAAAEIERAKCANDEHRLAVWRSRMTSLSAHGEKIFSVLAVLPLVVWSVPYCILCQIAQLPENQSDISQTSLRPKHKSVLSCA